MLAAFLPFAGSLGLLLKFLLWVVLSCLITELVGYFIHRLLHSEVIPALSRSHMIHHLKHYGPTQPMRPASKYTGTTEDRAALGDVGMEWLVPSVLLLGFFIGIFTLLGVPVLYQVTFVIVSLTWAKTMLNYIHNQMHIQDFWMGRHPLFRRWFVGARRLHDIHHHALDDTGRMNRNFGISFYFLDRLFGTFSGKYQTFNTEGFEQVRKRHDFL